MNEQSLVDDDLGRFHRKSGSAETMMKPCLLAAGMYKNQLQELAQRSCFNLPAYACIREGPDHAPRFKATVMFNGEFFESPNYCNTLRQAEHAAAEVALNILSRRGGSSQCLAARFFVSSQPAGFLITLSGLFDLWL
jgi:hypothetical protein